MDFSMLSSGKWGTMVLYKPWQDAFIVQMPLCNSTSHLVFQKWTTKLNNTPQIFEEKRIS